MIWTKHPAKNYTIICSHEPQLYLLSKLNIFYNFLSVIHKFIHYIIVFHFDIFLKKKKFNLQINT